MKIYMVSLLHRATIMTIVYRPTEHCFKCENVKPHSSAQAGDYCKVSVNHPRNSYARPAFFHSVGCTPIQMIIIHNSMEKVVYFRKSITKARYALPVNTARVYTGRIIYTGRMYR